MFPFPARPRIDVAEHCAADAADDVHEVGHVVPHKDDVIDLLAQIERDRKSTRLNSSHMPKSRMPSSA